MKNNKKLSMAQKAKNAGLPAQTVYNRLFHGWSEKKALSVPVRKKAKAKLSSSKTTGTNNTAIGQKFKMPLPIEKYESKLPSKGTQVFMALIVIIALVVVVVV